MKETYSKIGKNSSLFITPRDMGINEQTHFILRGIPKNIHLFESLIMRTPTNQSHLGDKWDSYTGLTNNAVDEFAKKLVKALDVKDVFVFSAFEPKCERSVNNLREDVLKSNNTILCLYIGGGGLKNSLYASVRNALAHGNIVETDHSVCLYSVSDKNKDYGGEFDTPLSFYLRIYNINKLEAYITVLNEYK